jgi:hypothetical protein
MGVTNLDTVQATAVFSYVAPKPPPAWALRWNVPQVAINGSAYQSSIAPLGGIGLSSKALFNLFSTALSSPANVYWVSTTGNDTTGTGAQGAPWATMSKAQTAANASGQPATIMVQAGSYPRTAGPTASNTIFPTVDTAWIFYGGRANIGTWDDFAAPSPDGTQTNTYSWTVSNVNKIADRLNFDQFGNYVEYPFVASPAICNRTPGTWSYAAGVLYVNRIDGAAVTNANTRMYRSTVGSPFRVTSPINFYIGGQTSADGCDLEGGAQGCVSYEPTTLPAAMKACVIDNVTAKYAGGFALNASNPPSTAEAGANGISINSVHGIAAVFNSRADANAADGFNCHNNKFAGASTNFVTVNCSGYNNGRSSVLLSTPTTSCNGWTIHEDVVGADFGGVYRNNRGGTIRPIGTSISWLVATVAANDLGDIPLGGNLPPTAIRVDDTAQLFGDSVTIDMPMGTAAVSTTANASAYFRNMAPFRANLTGAGTVGTY